MNLYSNPNPIPDGVGEDSQITRTRHSRSFGRKVPPLWANLGVRRRTVSEPTSTEKDHNNISWPETESETEQQAISGLEGRSRLGRGLAHITVRPNVLTQYIPRFLSTSLINCNTVVVDRWAKG